MKTWFKRGHKAEISGHSSLGQFRNRPLDARKGPPRLNTGVKKNRLKRHAGDIAGELGASVFLVLSIAVVTAALLIGCDRLLHSSLFAVRETMVRGCSEITEKDVLTLARVSPRATLLTINEEAIVSRIRTNPWAKDVFVGREFPDRLVIWVRERIAVALLEKENRLYLIDSKGEMFKKLAADEKADLPVLTGFFSGNILNAELLNKSLVLLNHLQKTTKETPDIGTVSEVHGNDTFGFSLFTNKGLCLQLGFDGYETKLKSLSGVMEDMERKNLKMSFAFIDLSNPEKISVQPREVLQHEKSELPTAKGKGLRI
jgi:cell division protein FtsQ